MNTPIRRPADTPRERAKMEQIARADIAAFGAGRAEMANAMIEQSGIRVRAERARGRAAGINPGGRFEPVSRDVFDDGWNSFEDLPPFKTEVQVEKPRTIITRNESPDISFDRSINPYRGCEHGCVYCFARPTHSYMGLSAGLDFEAKLFAKPDAAKLLDKELSKEGYQARTIAIGTNTDPYQPVEKQWRIMREILEVLEARNHPVGIVTKSALVTRDIDILARMAERGLAKVALSVTTLDRKLARTMEPRAATPTKRLETIRQLSDAGIPTSVMVAPVVPGLNDPGDRAHSGFGPGRRRPRCRIRHPASAAGGEPDFQGLAFAALPRPLPACHVADPLHARRQGLRCRMGQTHARHWALCLADRTPFRDRGAPAWAECTEIAAANRPFRAGKERQRAIGASLAGDNCPAQTRLKRTF